MSIAQMVGITVMVLNIMTPAIVFAFAIMSDSHD